MLSRMRKTSSIFTLITVGIVGCTAVATSERQVRDVRFSGYHNDINGTLSDGTPFTGKGWFREGRTRGDFCLQAAQFTCSGKYAANLSRRISGKFVCSDGSTGTYVTERIIRNDFSVPVKGTGTLSDGRTATAEFSPIKQGSGQTRCFVPVNSG